ncbi:MAG: glycosyltransferase [Candidatus Bathyarchaeota archaeon]|nr:glycosyltransferase [Candidatus Bathyarchaeota archaeon]MDH5793017.1 glycosyltransferase [Candidatus Bathyarchaeota archaeon]
MKIAVAHHSLNIPGGAERLCLATIEALRKKGHDVTLVTVEKTDWSIVQKNFRNMAMPNNEIYVTKNRLSKNLSKTPIASTYFLIYIMQLLVTKSQQKYELVLNTFGDVINSIADITYVHFPLRAALRFSQIPAFTSRSMWHIVAPLYNAATSFLDRAFHGELLTNSRFMQEIIKNVLRRNSLVVYPPVDVETFSSRCFKHRKKGYTAATVSSFTPKRHLEQVPLIAKHSKLAKFVVMGKADEYSLPTLREVEKKIKELHVQDRVTLLTNVPYNRFFETLSKAKVYLHVMPYDHFGISVVEAMASGCVPVVHRSGGPWQDILDCRQGEYGFSYTSVKEAASLIDALIEDERFRSKMASRAVYRAKEFDKAVFMKKIVEVVEKGAN